MPSPKLITLLLVAPFTLFATLNPAHAAQDPVVATTQVSLNALPDKTRIASDLEAHSQTASLSSLASVPNADLHADYTSIRSSIRNGETLEYRVTSIYNANVQGDPQREVDSMVSYQMTGDRWTLRDVKVTNTRETQRADSNSANERC